MLFIIFLIIEIQCINQIVETQDERLRQSCQSKSTGYFWNGQQCLKCKSPNCQCLSQGGCTSCKDNYFYDTKTTNCVPCPKGCQNCCKNELLTQYICTLCQSGYRNINGVCVQMGKCAMISMHGRCIECDSGYYVDFQFKCQKCAEGCEDCSNLTFCNKCSDGYRLINKSSQLICSLCTQTGCKYCENDKCSACKLGYFMNQNKECIQCLKDCDSCKTTTNCNSCNFYAVLKENNTKCKRCEALFENCLKCNTINNQTDFECASCQNGYYMHEKQCIHCINPNSTQTNKEAIRRCESTDVITQCMPGYLLFQNRYNDAEIVNILKYDCIENKNNCATISDHNGQCDSCLQGYILYQVDKVKKCITCVDQVEDCLDCYITPNQVFQCIQCSSGYYLNPNGLECTQCGENCEQCDGQQSCKTCIEGHVAQSGICFSCNVENCDYCESQGTCEKCSQGYGAVGGSCNLCQVGCKQCNYNQELCQECYDAYFLYMKSCVEIPNHCLRTNDDGFCYLCETQIFYDNQRDIFQDESSTEIKQYSDGQDSIFYKSVNGYCLKCSDYDTGQYFCPDACTDPFKMYQQIIIVSLFHILL